MAEEPLREETLCLAGTRPSMIAGVTIEPMVNAGKRYSKILPDKWTVVTKDRSLSAQWEHTCLVTKDGIEVLTRRKEEVFPWEQ